MKLMTFEDINYSIYKGDIIIDNIYDFVADMAIDAISDGLKASSTQSKSKEELLGSVKSILIQYIRRAYSPSYYSNTVYLLYTTLRRSYQSSFISTTTSINMLGISYGQVKCMYDTAMFYLGAIQNRYIQSKDRGTTAETLPEYRIPINDVTCNYLLSKYSSEEVPFTKNIFVAKSCEESFDKLNKEINILMKESKMDRYSFYDSLVKTYKKKNL